jgi:transcriptional regulator with XRE-family HTH domain
MPVRDSGQSSSRRNADPAGALGRRIAQLRARRGVSLRALAEKSGVSSSMICDIENEAKSPTIAVLSAIAGSLGVRLSDLVAEADPASSRVAIRRKGSQKLVDARGIERRLLAPDVSGSSCEIIHMTIPPHKDTGTIASHRSGTTEYVHLAQGSLEVRVGNHYYKLKAGDCAGFQADVRHAYANSGSTRAVLFVVIEHAK